MSDDSEAAGGEVIQFVPAKLHRRRAYRPTTWRGVIVADIFRAVGGPRAAQAAMQSAPVLDHIPRGQGVNERCTWRGLLIRVWFARVEVSVFGSDPFAGMMTLREIRDGLRPTEAYGIRLHLHERMQTLVITRPRRLLPIPSLQGGGRKSRRRKVA